MATERRLRTASRTNLQQERQGSRTTIRSTTQSRSVVSEDVQEEALITQRFQPGEEPAFVRVNAGFTHNLGNFESLRIDVSVSLPCLPEEVEDAYARASDFVRDKLTEEQSNWLSRTTPQPRRATRR